MYHVSESIIQTHTSSLLEGGGAGRVGGQRRMRQRGEKRERRELKMERWRDGEENVSWLPYQSICSIKINLNLIWMSSYASWEDILSSLTRKNGGALKWRLDHLVLSSRVYLNIPVFIPFSSTDLAESLSDQQMYICICIFFPFLPHCGIYRTARRPCHRGRGK